MTEQQYRVIADRDKGDDPQWDDVAYGDRYHAEMTDAGDFDRILRIERPVPTTDEPPRIEDMAPGTRLVAQLHEVYSDNRPFTYMVIEVPHGKRLAATDGAIWSADEFDPSTIRDVTPPKEQS